MKKSQLLNEIMGVPKAVNFWVDYFSYIIVGMVKGIVSKDEIETSNITYENEEGEEVKAVAYRGKVEMDGKKFMDWILKIGGYDLKSLLNDPRFKQFPLYNPNIKIVVYFMPEEVLDIELKHNKVNFVNAYHSFDVTKKAISRLMDHQIFVNQTFGFEITLPEKNLDNLNTETLRKQIKSTISHELTHAYEAYNRVKTSGDPYQGRESFLNAAVSLMRDDKYPQWKEFLHLVYLHLGFEINARVTQFYYDIKDEGIKTTDEFLEKLKESTAWRELQMLENFDADKFIKSFEIKKLDFFGMIEDIGKQIEREKQGLPKIGQTRTPEEAMKHLIQGWDYVLQILNLKLKSIGVYKGQLMELVPQKALEDPYYFFKFFEQRFHKKAERFKRKLYRIASLAVDKNLIGESEEFDWVPDPNEDISPAEEFIYNKFKECKLEPVTKKNWVNWTKYVDKNGEILFLDNINTGSEEPELWFDYDEIYLKLEEMGLSYEEMKKLCIDMLYETHKRKVLTAANHLFQF